MAVVIMMGVHGGLVAVVIMVVVHGGSCNNDGGAWWQL